MNAIEAIEYFAIEEGELGLEIRFFEEEGNEEKETLAAEGLLTGSVWFNASEGFYEIEADAWYNRDGIFKLFVNETDKLTALKAFFEAYKVLADKFANG